MNKAVLIANIRLMAAEAECAATAMHSASPTFAKRWTVVLKLMGEVTTQLTEEPFEDLLARSSLGTPEAVALRSRVDPKTVKRILERADELEAVRKNFATLEKRARDSLFVADAVDLLMAELCVETATRMRLEKEFHAHFGGGEA